MICTYSFLFIHSIHKIKKLTGYRIRRPIRAPCPLPALTQSQVGTTVCVCVYTHTQDEKCAALQYVFLTHSYLPSLQQPQSLFISLVKIKKKKVLKILFKVFLSH